MISMNNQNNIKGRIRSVTVNERGQFVIPEDIRKELGIEGASTLILIEREGELILRRESDVLAALDDDSFWRAVSRETMERAWHKEDAVWDAFARKDVHA